MKSNSMYEKKELLAESLLRNSGKFIKLSGSELFVVERGKGESLILANGIAASVYTWRKVIPKLSKSFRVHALDYKGTGLSEKPRDEYSIEEFSKEIFDLMNYYKIDKAVLAGNSLGGEVILNFAIKYPERVKALILLDTAGYQLNKEITAILVRLGRFKAVGRFIKKHASKRFARRLIEWALYNDELIDREMVNSYYKPMRTKGAFDAFIKLVKNLSYTDFDYSKVKDIEVPTLIIWGKEDKWIPVSDAYKFHKDIKNSKLVILGGCGHAPQEEMPDKVSELIKEFIEENINR